MFKVNNKVAKISLLLTLNYVAPCSSVSIANFEQVNAGWDNGFHQFLEEDY